MIESCVITPFEGHQVERAVFNLHVPIPLSFLGLFIIRVLPRDELIKAKCNTYFTFFVAFITKKCCHPEKSKESSFLIYRWLYKSK